MISVILHITRYPTPTWAYVAIFAFWILYYIFSVLKGRKELIEWSKEERKILAETIEETLKRIEKYKKKH